jgi:large repetitive protein
MVAAVSSSGLGLFGSSRNILGGAGTQGDPSVGRGTDRVYVNAATGNLIVQSQDERLSAQGLGLSLVHARHRLNRARLPLTVFRRFGGVK